MNEEFYSIGRGSLNINGKLYCGLDYEITDFMRSLKEENQQLKDNWNKLKEFIAKEYYMYLPLEATTKSITILIDKMQELEKSDK